VTLLGSPASGINKRLMHERHGSEVASVRRKDFVEEEGIFNQSGSVIELLNRKEDASNGPSQETGNQMLMTAN
jgi:hypothetical protein